MKSQNGLYRDPYRELRNTHHQKTEEHIFDHLPHQIKDRDRPLGSDYDAEVLPDQ